MTDFSQLQPHLGGGFEAQRFIECPALVAGVQIDGGETFSSAPVDHGSHQLPGNTPSPELGVDIDVENRGPAAFKIVGMAGPRIDHDRSSRDDLFSESSLASFILADSSFFCTRDRSF